MRLAVVTDIHANLTALEAVVADLREVAPDLVVHGGDLMAGGARPAEVIDRIRDLSWPGVYGNADEMLWMPEQMSRMLPGPHLAPIRERMLAYTIPRTLAAIGAERLDWLKALPLRWSESGTCVVHAGPHDVWQIVPAATADDELQRVFEPLRAERVVYGHIHTPYIRRLPAFTVINAGAVSLSFDGDPRASYALIDGDRVSIRRVAYDIDAEIDLLRRSNDPFAASTIENLRTGRYAPFVVEEAAPQNP